MGSQMVGMSGMALAGSGNGGLVRMFQGSKMRMTEHNGKIMFCVKDICNILSIKNVSQACSDLDADEKGICQIYTLGGIQNMLCVTESGLYAVIIKSEKNDERAKAFRKWITSEILPSIRQYGMYATPQTMEELISNPDLIIGIGQKIKEERALRMIAEEQAELSEQKAVICEKQKQLSDSKLVQVSKITKITTWSAREIGAFFGLSAQEVHNILESQGLLRYVERWDRWELMGKWFGRNLMYHNVGDKSERWTRDGANAVCDVIYEHENLCNGL